MQSPGGADVGSATIEPTAVDGSSGRLRRWPLSYPQAMLWFLSKRWPEADMVHRLTVSFVETLPTDVAEPDVRRVLAEVLATHEPLRTVLVAEDGDPTQVVHPEVTVPLQVVDLRHLAPAAAEVERDQALADFAAGSLSAFELPVCRFALVLGPDGERQLAGLVHHLFFDYWSARLVAGQVRAGLTAGLPTPDPERLQYVDFLTWERDWFEGEGSRADVQHWVDRLTDLVPPRLPTDRPRPWRPRGTALRSTVVVPRPVMDAVRSLAAELRITPYMVLTGCFTRLLAAWSGQDDVALPTLFAGRTEAALNDVVGYFDNIMVVRNQVVADDDVRRLLQRTAEVMIADQDHHDVPLLRVLQAVPRLALLLQDPRNVWPLFHYEVDSASLLGRPEAGDRSDDASDVAAPDTTAVDRGSAGRPDDEITYSFGADLDVALRDTEEGLYVRVLYNLDLYDSDTVAGLLTRFSAALARIVEPGALDRPSAWLVRDVG